MEQDAVAAHPIRLVNTDDLRRSRLTVFFRLLPALPHIIWLGLWGFVVCFVAAILAFVGWFYALATRRMSAGIENLGHYAPRYESQTLGYSLLLTETYPSLSGAPTA